MKNIKILMLLFLVICISFLSCNRDKYLTGGSLHTSKFNVTTYDFLKNQTSGVFDTLVLLIDKAGIKDKVNQQGITFFAPTDYAINNYLGRRTLEEQKVDESRKWTIDSLIKYELSKFTDSVNVYFVDQLFPFDKLTENGVIVPTQKSGASSVVSYETITPDNPDYEKLGGNTNTSAKLRLVYYTFLFRPLTPPVVASEISSADGNRNLVQTSGIETTTGMIQVLSNQHILFCRKP